MVCLSRNIIFNEEVVTVTSLYHRFFEPSRDQLVLLLKAAAAGDSKLSVAQVMDTGASFAEWRILKGMVKVDMSESIITPTRA